MQNHGTTALPPDLRRLVDTWLEVERQTDILLDPLDDEQFNWSPGRGSWSIAQCFDHLNTMNRAYIAAIRDAVAAARAAGLGRHGPVRPTWFGRRFIASQEPPVRLKVRTVKTMRPAARRLKAEVWPEFVRMHGQLRAFVSEECPAVDLNKARLRSPVLRVMRLRAGTALYALAAHDRRHLWQAQNVRRLPGFPRS